MRRFAYGPATDKGFNMMLIFWGKTKLSDDHLQAIEAEMRKIVKENIAMKPYILSREEAIDMLENWGEKPKTIREGKYSYENIGIDSKDL